MYRSSREIKFKDSSHYIHTRKIFRHILYIEEDDHILLHHVVTNAYLTTEWLTYVGTISTMTCNALWVLQNLFC